MHFAIYEIYWREQKLEMLRRFSEPRDATIHKLKANYNYKRYVLYLLSEKELKENCMLDSMSVVVTICTTYK